MREDSCDLLKNSYLCLLNNTNKLFRCNIQSVVICWKIRIFAYWTTPSYLVGSESAGLWFAEKFVSLLIEQHLDAVLSTYWICCDLLKNSYLCLLNNTQKPNDPQKPALWFAEKFVSLLIEQHHLLGRVRKIACCDLLKNSYLCLLNNTIASRISWRQVVVICWKIRIFAYWTTPISKQLSKLSQLWFAEKFVSLLIEQHQHPPKLRCTGGCDLLKNSYLCLLNNTGHATKLYHSYVVICWKIRIFAYWTTPQHQYTDEHIPLWFAEKFVSLLIEQHQFSGIVRSLRVVICWKIRIFAYWTTPTHTK